MYTITIEKQTFEKQIKGKEWKVVDKAGNYDHTPEIEKIVEVKKTIYIQIVEELDLVAVINAVNGIKE